MFRFNCLFVYLCPCTRSPVSSGQWWRPWLEAPRDPRLWSGDGNTRPPASVLSHLSVNLTHTDAHARTHTHTYTHTSRPFVLNLNSTLSQKRPWSPSGQICKALCNFMVYDMMHQLEYTNTTCLLLKGAIWKWTLNGFKFLDCFRRITSRTS